MTTELDKVIAYFGSQAALARALDPGLSPMAVSHWKRRGIPLSRAVQIERISGGLFTMERLCPNEFCNIS